MDIVLARAHATDEALVDALQNAATYRRLTQLALAQAFGEWQHRLKVEQRLRQVMGVEAWPQE